MKFPVTCLLFLTLALLGGCGDPVSDMGDQRKNDTMDKSEFYENGASARPLVAGVVPHQFPEQPYTQTRSTGRGGLENLAPTPRSMPFPVTREIVDRGQSQFTIFCAPCHGRLGNGEGMIVQRGMPRPPSFHVPRLNNVDDGHFFDVISHGFGAMFGYGDRVAPADRWAIVAYVRILQAAPDAPGLTTSDTTRAALVAGGDTPKGGAR